MNFREQLEPECVEADGKSEVHNRGKLPPPPATQARAQHCGRRVFVKILNFSDDLNFNDPVDPACSVIFSEH